MPRGAASLGESASGMRAKASVGAITASPKPPSYAHPGTFRLSQTMKSPCLHVVQ
jgi:hypothetical protein